MWHVRLAPGYDSFAMHVIKYLFHLISAPLADIINRLLEFAKKHDILYRCQFGFRKNHSTSHAQIHLVNKTASAIDQHETTVGVFLDLSKALDILDHQILFAK